jgi:hypothetical protein
MNGDSRLPDGVPDMGIFQENRCRFPPEQLLPYEGKWVAWSLDGTRILASGEDVLDVENKLDASGIDASRVVFGFVPPSDESLL